MSSARPPLSFPIILIHGWSDKPTETGTWKVVERSLAESGIHFYVPAVARYGSIDERVDRLIKEMTSIYHGQTVHLIGHSMGGIVARDVAGRSDLAFQVLTVTTLGTPNRGLTYLDHVPVVEGTSDMATMVRSWFGSDFGGFTNLSSKYMADFNAKTPNNPDVKYFSWAGVLLIPALPYLIHSLFVSRYYAKHDGLVGVDTASWDVDLGPGTHLGTVPGLTHGSIICLEIFDKTLPHLWASEQGMVMEVEAIAGGVGEQLKRRYTGYKNAFIERRYAKRDMRKYEEHAEGKPLSRSLGYQFENDGYLKYK